MPTCATSIWESTLLAASLPRFRFFISSKLISWLVNSDCIFCWKTKTAISKVWGKYCVLFQFLDQLILEHIEQQYQSVQHCTARGRWPCPSAQSCVWSEVFSSGLPIPRARETRSSWRGPSAVWQRRLRLNLDFYFFS